MENMLPRAIGCPGGGDDGVEPVGRPTRTWCTACHMPLCTLLPQTTHAHDAALTCSQFGLNQAACRAREAFYQGAALVRDGGDLEVLDSCHPRTRVRMGGVPWAAHGWRALLVAAPAGCSAPRIVGVSTACPRELHARGVAPAGASPHGDDAVHRWHDPMVAMTMFAPRVGQQQFLRPHRRAHRVATRDLQPPLGALRSMLNDGCDVDSLQLATKMLESGARDGCILGDGMAMVGIQHYEGLKTHTTFVHINRERLLRLYDLVTQTMSATMLARWMLALRLAYRVIHCCGHTLNQGGQERLWKTWCAHMRVAWNLFVTRALPRHMNAHKRSSRAQAVSHGVCASPQTRAQRRHGAAA